MAWDESKVNHVNVSSLRTRPIPPETPARWTKLKDGTLALVRNAVRIDPSEGPILGDTPFQDPGNEHFYLCRTLCKQHRYTKSFDGLMFSRMEYYQRSLIRVVVDLNARSSKNPHGIIGFSNFWHKVRTPYSKIYFFVTDVDHLRRGVATALFNDFQSVVPAGFGIELDVNKTNPSAIAFWERQGFTVVSSSLKDTCWFMKKEALS